MEEPIIFDNDNGLKLHGIVHIPKREQSPSRKVIGINLLNPGIKSRVAPNRLNVKIARRLCEDGFPVLRFDPSGIGDSEGELPAGEDMLEIWGSIQKGLFVKDTKKANDFFVEKYGLDELILIGNCGGAITAILTAAIDNRVNKLVLIDMPVILLGSDYSFADRIIRNDRIVNRLFIGYLKNIFSISSWRNLLRGKTDFKALQKIMSLKGRQIVRSITRREVESHVECAEKTKLNQAFFNAFELLMKKNKQMLFITAGKDGGTETFNAYFIDKYLAADSRYREYVEAYCIEDANHIYTLTEWQNELIDKIASYVTTP